MGSIMNTTEMLLHRHLGYVHVGGTQGEVGVLITGSLQETDSGPDCNGRDGHGFMGRKAS